MRNLNEPFVQIAVHRHVQTNDDGSISELTELFALDRGGIVWEFCDDDETRETGWCPLTSKRIVTADDELNT